MARTIVYWAATGVVVVMMAFAGFSYLMAGPEVVQGFTHLGYPQQFRVILGIAKLLAAIALAVPGLPTLKEWAYAGLTFSWISAIIAHYKAHDGLEALAPLLLLVFLFVSYVTRPSSRRWHRFGKTA